LEKEGLYVHISASTDASFLKLHTSHRSLCRYWRCDLVSDRPVMKGKAVSRLPFEGFFWKPTPSNLSALPTNGVRVISIGHQWRALYLESKVPSRQYLCFHSREFPSSPHTHTHQSSRPIEWELCQFGCDRPIMKGTCKTKYLYGSNSGSIRGFSWKFTHITLRAFPKKDANLVAICQ